MTGRAPGQGGAVDWMGYNLDVISRYLEQHLPPEPVWARRMVTVGTWILSTSVLALLVLAVARSVIR